MTPSLDCNEEEAWHAEARRRGKKRRYATENTEKNEDTEKFSCAHSRATRFFSVRLFSVFSVAPW